MARTSRELADDARHASDPFIGPSLERIAYSQRQTALCNKVREHLQSLAILAVESQEMDPSSDPLRDQLDLIEHDLTCLRGITERLNRNEV